MKSNILQHAVFVLAMLGPTALSAQYIVGGCETETGILTVGQETFTVTATGRFINSGTANFTGVSILTNHGGISEQVESSCTADYRNPCGHTPGVSGANIFDNSVATTTINGDNPLRMYAATIDRNIQLDNEWQIIHAFSFTTGMVITDREDMSHFLHFRGTSSVIGADLVKHVNGYAGWSGTGTFTLPVGDGMKYRPVGLEGNCSTVFKAAYFSGDPGLATLPAGGPFSTTSKPAGITVSQKGYWDIKGATATPITLHFDADSDLDLIASSLSQLVILGWDGSAWVSLGQTGSTGTLAGNGTVTCGAVVPDHYSAFALGGGCTNTPNVSISGPTGLCPGESATLTASGGISYAWNTGADTPTITVTTGGSYSVTATDANGCTAVSTATVLQSAAIVLNATTTPVDCNQGANGSVTLTVVSGGVSPFTYSWSNGAQTKDLPAVPVGSYTVTVTDVGGCTAVTTAAVTIDLNNVQPLKITCPASVPTLVANSSCQAFLDDYSAQAVITGGCAGILNPSVQIPAPGATLNPGFVMVQLSVSNNVGESSSCNVQVRIAGGCSGN